MNNTNIEINQMFNLLISTKINGNKKKLNNC